MCNRALGFTVAATLSDVEDDGVCELAIEHLPLGLAVFLQLVLDVVEVRSKKQVCRVDARGVVAVMQNIDPLWDGTDQELVRESVCKMLSQPSVTRFISVPMPKDASGVSDVTHPGKEAVIQLPLLPASALASPGAKLAVSGSNLARNSIENEG